MRRLRLWAALLLIALLGVGCSERSDALVTNQCRESVEVIFGNPEGLREDYRSSTSHGVPGLSTVLLKDVISDVGQETEGVLVLSQEGGVELLRVAKSTDPLGVIIPATICQPTS